MWREETHLRNKSFECTARNFLIHFLPPCPCTPQASLGVISSYLLTLSLWFLSHCWCCHLKNIHFKCEMKQEYMNCSTAYVSAIVAEILGNLMFLRQSWHCQVSPLNVQHLILYSVIISLQMISYCLIPSPTNICPHTGVIIGWALHHISKYITNEPQILLASGLPASVCIVTWKIWGVWILLSRVADFK